MSFDTHITRDPETGLSLDLTDAPVGSSQGIEEALRAMAALEAGGIANPDEERQVGHYWLRDPSLAPDAATTQSIVDTWAQIEALDAGGCTDLVMAGIGGSALGPQLVWDCLVQATTSPRLHFLDNTDPEGFDRILSPLKPERTLVIVISKSGSTPETRNAMLAAQAHYQRAGVSFADHAIAITTPGSPLDELAASWRARFPLWDWVGGRTSVTSPVGLVPMALCGLDWRSLLAGAKAIDVVTRGPLASNPAAQLAVAWRAAEGRALVIEPYRDRLALLARYLQQLVMESLGKSLDRQGRRVEQGLTVYGNKGSTDQHAFMQQLRDGCNDALVHFVETEAHGPSTPVDPPFDAADHLLGAMLGTRAALAEAGRPTITITVPDASAHTLGMLIALFERAVGIYGELIDVNAYHQPGVEAGKRAARATLELLRQLPSYLENHSKTAEEIGSRAGADARVTWRLLTHLVGQGRVVRQKGATPAEDRFSSLG